MGARHQLALVGCGAWGRYILRDLLSLGCEVSVLVRSESGRRHARQSQAARAVSRVEDLPAVEGVVVATPTTSHAAVLDEVLDLGVPVFVEKPMTDDPESARRLAARAPDRLFVMDKWRYHPGVELLGQIARSGELGPVVGLRTTRVGWGNPHSDSDCVWTLAPHDLAIGLEVLGAIPQPRSAVADHDGHEATGLVAVLGQRPWQVLEVSVRHSDRCREVRLVCRDGVAVLPDGYSDRVLVTRGTASHAPDALSQEARPISSELPLLRELRAFLGFLEGGPPPRSSAAEGAANVATVAALRALAGLSDAPGPA